MGYIAFDEFKEEEEGEQAKDMKKMGSVNEIRAMSNINSARVEDGDSKMEGWLYLIRSNRFGLQYSRRRYYILRDNILRSFKSIPMNDDQEVIRSAVIDACIRVTDNGRENINRKMFFIFTLYNTSDLNDRLKLGASSSEEAAQWIRSLQGAATKESPNPAVNFVSCSRRRWPSLRICTPSKKTRKHSIDWTSCSSIHTEAMTSDVIAPSPWIIFGCQNGLRLFKEAKDWNSGQRHWDNHPAIMAVGVVDGTSEAIFRTLMSLGSSRAEWDFCFYQGNVVEHIDGHTDIIHKQLYNDWLPWGMQRRDLLLRRYWRREDDGTYVILYHSVFNRKCRPQKGYVRAWLKSGGYVVTPINQGKQSLVKHMLSVDWKFWKLYLRPSSARAITIRMLERVAALREMFKYKAGNFSTEYLSGELMKDIGLPLSEREEIIKNEVLKPEEAEKVEELKFTENEPERLSTQPASLMGFNDASDEFFDVPEPVDHELQESVWSPEFCPEFHSQTSHQSKLPCAANFVKKLHELAVQKKGYVDLQELAKEDSSFCSYGITLQNDPNHILPCTWTTADPSTFLIRGASYLIDNHKVKAQGTSMQMVGADWLRSDKREDDLAGRPGSIVQMSAERGGPEFFFVVNIQVPGTTTYNLGLYYMMQSPLEENPVLQRFVNGDDAYRNSRFKLIPYISKGSWIVKQSVGKKACLVGQALEINYFRGRNYLELDIDVGSSTVARGVVSLVLGYLNNLVIEMAFLIQGNTAEELPEFLLGTCRLNHLDASKSVCVNP